MVHDEGSQLLALAAMFPLWFKMRALSLVLWPPGPPGALLPAVVDGLLSFETYKPTKQLPILCYPGCGILS